MSNKLKTVGGRIDSKDKNKENGKGRKRKNWRMKFDKKKSNGGLNNDN